MKAENLPALAGSNGYAPGIRVEGIGASEFDQETNHSSLNFHDLLFIVFRHKWKIFVCASAGIIAAAAVYLFAPPVYESEAKLFVRYVVDKSAIDGIDPQIKTPNPQNDSLINSEIEILSSSDSIRKVAEAVGVERIASDSKGDASIEKAIHNIYRALSVAAIKGTNIISVSFRSGDPKLPMQVLQEVINRYFDKHLEVHRTIGAFDF